MTDGPWNSSVQAADPIPFTGGRAVPHSVDAEEWVLGSVLRSGDAADVVMGRLVAECFYVPALRTIFGAMQGLYDEQEPIDVLTVADRLGRGDALERIGGIRRVDALWDGVPSAANVDYYTKVVWECYQRRCLIEAAGRVQAAALDRNRDFDAVLNQAEEAVLGVAGRGLAGGLDPLAPLLDRVLKGMEEAETAGDGLVGLSTGLSDLDAKIGGLHPAQLVVVAGRPGMGKSALALNIASRVARDDGPVALFSLEMSPLEVAYRWLASTARVDTAQLRAGLTSAQVAKVWDRLITAAAGLDGVRLYADEGSRTVTDIRAKCRRLRRSKGLSLVVVDYMQLMQGRARENRQQEIADISLNLKALARELNVPVIAVSQLNRGLESRSDRRPQLGDLRESGAIEQDADVVLMIYRDEYYNPESSDQKGMADIIVAKQRAGPTGVVKTTFAAAYTRFDNLAATRFANGQRRRR